VPGRKFILCQIFLGKKITTKFLVRVGGVVVVAQALLLQHISTTLLLTQHISNGFLFSSVLFPFECNIFQNDESS